LEKKFNHGQCLSFAESVASAIKCTATELPDQVDLAALLLDPIFRDRQIADCSRAQVDNAGMVHWFHDLQPICRDCALPACSGEKIRDDVHDFSPLLKSDAMAVKKKWRLAPGVYSIPIWLT
jgi:hypothetical protein